MLAVESSVRTGWAIRATATAIVALAVIRIASTYAEFNHTYDEPFHVLRGMLWITGAPYRHVEHPPLAPICFAIGPYLDGAVVVDTGEKVEDGNRILYENGSYSRTLTLAGMGNLGFFIWSAVVVWRWANMLRGPGLALLAVALYTALPPLLAHAGVATTDMAITAAFSAFLHALMRWLDEATPCRALVLGGATGLALLAKMSALLFLPLATLVVIGLYLLAGPQRPRDDFKWSGRLLQGVVIALIGVELVFAGYRFSVGPVRTIRERSELPQFARDLLAGDGLTGSAARRILSASIPAPEFFRGILRDSLLSSLPDTEGVAQLRAEPTSRQSESPSTFTWSSFDIVAVWLIVTAFIAVASYRARDSEPSVWFKPDRIGDLGGEYDEIALAMRGGRGFTDPFREPSGPTAWMPPVLPCVLAALYWMTGDDRSTVIEVIYGAQGLVIVLTGWLVVWQARRLHCAPCGYLILVGGLAANFFLLFQYTHAPK